MVRSKLKDYFVSFLLMALSILLSLVLGEVILRIIVEPGDYLQVYLVKDPILGHKSKPNSLGHDSWGYRNRSVPRSVDIVTIGDSQTYGVSAAAINSWPAKLEKLIRKDVYNLSLGGYGPPQYSYLLERKALNLNPSLVIVAFYLGNDLLDTYKTVYSIDYWKDLRNPHLLVEQAMLADTSGPYKRAKPLAHLRNWLAHHSILYRLTVYSFGNVFRFLEMKYVRQSDNNITILEDKKYNILSGFAPSVRLRALNLKDKKVREGFRLALELFYQMREICLKRGVGFVVVLIPTKESVFSEFIENRRDLNNSHIIDELVTNERMVNKEAKEYFRKNDIMHIDVLADMKVAVEEKTIYPQNENGHPNKEGYEIIAESIYKFIRNHRNDRIGSSNAY